MTKKTEEVGRHTSLQLTCRMLGWSILFVMTAFLLNNILTHGFAWPGPGEAFSEPNFASLGQFALYPLAIIVSLVFVVRHPDTTLRADGRRIARINAFVIRAAFWSVLIVGVADIAISFLRIEGFLEALVGEQLAKDLGRSHFRGLNVHIPLIFVGVVLAGLTRTLGFPWLALLIVIAELGIVIMRFVFSYEQAFMSDLVRFWYAALFLFASAYTLQEEGHVRVDVLYASFTERSKALVNAIGTLLLGIVFCWTILIVGMGQKTSIINAPVLSFEVTQAGFGLYVKYMMAGFLGIFAISMMIQFVSYFMEAVADYREEPGHIDHASVVH